MPKKQNRVVRFNRAQVQEHIRKCHPLCPMDIQAKLTYRLVTQSWSSSRIGRAFGIVSTNFVRHEMTDYEILTKKHCLTREEARQIVAPEVRDIIQSWSTQEGVVDPDEVIGQVPDEATVLTDWDPAKDNDPASEDSRADVIPPATTRCP